MLTSPRNTFIALLGLFVVWFIYFGDYVSTPKLSTPSTAKSPFGVAPEDKAPSSKSALVIPSHIQTYYDQIFSSASPDSPSSLPPTYDFPGVAAACARTEWKAENSNVYLKCGGIVAGMTSIISQVKVCFKMAIDAGVNIALPTIPLRDSTDLTNFNFFNGSAYMQYDGWFDEAHLREAMGRACPQLKIVTAADIKDETAAATKELSSSQDGGGLKVAHKWNMDISKAPGFKMLSGYFWVGRPFRTWFEHELLRLRFFDYTASKNDAAAGGLDGPGAAGAAAAGDALQARQVDNSNTKITADLASTKKPTKEAEGVTVISIASQFLIFRITEDATGRELALWNDLSAMIRFNEATRAVTTKVEARIDQPYVGIHFRAEKDNIWSSYEDQLKADLDALDKMWTRYGSGDKPGTQGGPKKPLVYLACGDEAQIKGFEEAAALRGWNVTSKYDIVKNDAETLRQLKELPFDFQGAVDMGIMLKSWFFMGISGSAFSSTVANLRDSTGRYRGSSLQFPDDDHARTHLFNDGDAASYPCCL